MFLNFCLGSLLFRYFDFVFVLGLTSKLPPLCFWRKDKIFSDSFAPIIVFLNFYIFCFSFHQLKQVNSAIVVCYWETWKNKWNEKTIEQNSCNRAKNRDRKISIVLIEQFKYFHFVCVFFCRSVETHRSPLTLARICLHLQNIWTFNKSATNTTSINRSIIIWNNFINEFKRINWTQCEIIVSTIFSF